MRAHLHLDLIGGIAGDMFVAALLHARPALEAELASGLAAFGLSPYCGPASDGALTGCRFEVREGTAVADGSGDPEPHRHPGDADHGHGPTGAAAHAHTDWRSIRQRLLDGRLDGAIARRTVAIFELLAQAEARIHGVAVGDVTFHEVGAADSIGDIVAAATLIERLGLTSTSCGPVPTGSGRVWTAHGIMPVPAPATALLLEGLATIDDGIAGERVTPTGAAILRHLGPGPRGTVPMRPVASGFGFGTRRFEGISNCLRAMLLDADGSADASDAGSGRVPHRQLAVVAFEVDDQSGEDLATGIERIRAIEGVHDVVQMSAIGKKGRFAFHLQVLAARDAVERVIEGCFAETTTIGLRIGHVEGRALARRTETVEIGSEAMRVKLVERPHGVTGKAEADDVAGAGLDAAGRGRLREAASRAALGTEPLEAEPARAMPDEAARGA